ncbi:metal-dependent hydrolase [Thalassotalea sp. Y01]|uniref:metal-dependent hydrolase n=1 Tax=Thalassotalea sp. Y01 TaxID=2729613 RepID=UPI00145D5DF1|nr:metal-dependent hydrolase [Thalassotalea sp. Y01]NMP17031.1 metal-dependent hydrolase [Thalassotalea sp. Y01]
MDALTHAIVGAGVGQWFKHKQDDNRLASWQCSAIGAVAALLPDLDYLLFWLHPLEFLAYWHRAESHSIVLAPLWAYLFMGLLLLCKRYLFAQVRINRKWLYTLLLTAIMSHLLLDALTVYGTQWFAPLSSYKVSFSLLFVIDGYFTGSCLLGLLIYCCYDWRNSNTNLEQATTGNKTSAINMAKNKMARHAIWTVPLSYLLLVAGIKQYTLTLLSKQPSQLASGSTISNSRVSKSTVLLPQPFSPLLWLAITQQDNGLQYSYIRLANDKVARQLSLSLGKSGYLDRYNDINSKLSRDGSRVQWQHTYHPASSDDVNIVNAWRHPLMQGFRDFAVYPVFLQYSRSKEQECFWFSDLRYHWPYFLPSFRYGVCREPAATNDWHLYRKRYLSNETQVVN